MHQISTVENPAAKTDADENLVAELTKNESSKDKWFDEYDEYMEPPDAGEMCDDQSDISDFEETFIKKRKKKTKVGICSYFQILNSQTCFNQSNDREHIGHSILVVSSHRSKVMQKASTGAFCITFD